MPVSYIIGTALISFSLEKKGLSKKKRLLILSLFLALNFVAVPSSIYYLGLRAATNEFDSTKLKWYQSKKDQLNPGKAIKFLNNKVMVEYVDFDLMNLYKLGYYKKNNEMVLIQIK